MVADTAQGNLEDLARRAAAGSPDSLHKLIELSWPFLHSYARSLTAIRWLGRDEDHAHNVVTAVIARLNQPGVLRTFEGGGDFRRWLATVAHNEAITYVRRLGGRSHKPRSREDEPSRKALLNLFANSADLEELTTRPKYTEQQRVAQLLDAARATLDERQLQALSLWLEDHDAAAIGEALGCSPKDAEKVRRAAIARLRDQFGFEDLV